MKRTTQNSTKTRTWLARMTLHTILCWTLALWQVIPATAYADSTLEGQSTTQNVQTPGLPSISENQSGGSSGSLVRRETTDEGGNVTTVEGNDMKATGKFLYANLALVAVGLLTPSLVMTCWKSWSVRVFAVAAALYVANEIGIFTKFNRAINREMKAYLGRGDEDKQIMALETAAKQTRKAKEAAERRAMIAKIAAAGFGVAAGIALAENMEWFGMTNACPPPPPAPTLLWVHNSPLKLNASDKLFASFSEIDSFSLLRKDKNAHSDLIADYSLKPIQTQPKFGQVKKGGLTELFINAVIPSAYAKDKDERTAGDVKSYKNSKGEKTIVVNSVTSKVAALGLGGLGALAVAKVFSASIGPAFSAIATNPLYRSIGFGIFAGVAMGASSESQGAADKLGMRAREYDKLANSLRERVDQSINTETGSINQYIDPTVQDFDNKSGGIGNNSTCFTGGAAQGVTPAKNCDCAKNDSCAGPQMPDSTGIPSFSGSGLLTNGLNNLGGTAKDLFRGDLKGASTKGKALTNGAARITKLRKALADKFNKDRLENGGKPIDFEKATRVGQSRLERDINKAFNNLTDKERAALNGITNGSFGLDKDKDDKEDKNKDLAEKTGVDTGKVAAVDVNPNAGGGSGKSNSGATWDFNFEDDAANAAAEQDAMAAALAEKEDENYQVDGDINDDRNKNLFNIITRRYLKSAYPVIFEEK